MTLKNEMHFGTLYSQQYWISLHPAETTSTNVARGDCVIARTYLYARNGFFFFWSVVCSYWLLLRVREVSGSIPGPCRHAVSTLFSTTSFIFGEFFFSLPQPCPLSYSYLSYFWYFWFMLVTWRHMKWPGHWTLSLITDNTVWSVKKTKQNKTKIL